MNAFPFIILKRKDSEFYYVRFKDSKSWKSTKQTDYNMAVQKAWELYYTSKEEIEKKSVINQVKVDTLNEKDVNKLLEELKRKGFIKTYIQSNKTDIKAIDYLYDFWNPEKSIYLKEKERKDHKVHKCHIRSSVSFINNYWKELLGDKYLSEITKQDIQSMFDILDDLKLNGNTKNHILRSVLTPLKFAYNKEMIDKDLSAGWTFYSPKYKKKVLVTKEMARALFNHQWRHPMAQLANLVAMCTGMRAGEILSLTLQDIGEDCIYVNHNWNYYDKLKNPKTEETRIEYVYNRKLIEMLIAMGNTNPYEEGVKYIFYATIPDKPLDEKVLLKNLRYELSLLGIQDEELKKYTFHAWRHFYASYMRGKVSDKLLKSQTGHKSLEMLDHYSEHQIEGDVDQILIAQREVFKDIIS